MSVDTEIEYVMRDICYFYYEQAFWGTNALYADLSFGSMYKLPYWSYLRTHSDSYSAEELEFLRQGCLMIIFAMCLDTIEGSGNYFISNGLQDVCRSEINSVETRDADTIRLIAAINLAIDMAAASMHDNEEISKLSVWAKDTFVGGYFLHMAQQWQDDLQGRGREPLGEEL